MFCNSTKIMSETKPQKFYPFPSLFYFPTKIRKEKEQKKKEKIAWEATRPAEWAGPVAYDHARGAQPASAPRPRSLSASGSHPSSLLP